MRYKKFIYLGLILAVTVGFLLAISACSKEEEQTTSGGELYTCGMHPNVIQEGPGNCPICGMKLTPLNPEQKTESMEVATTQKESKKEKKKGKKILYWQAPMDPSYISDKPGKSPMGMDLIPVYEGEESFGSTVRINPTVEWNIGVRTDTVRKRDLTRTIRAFGRIDYNEQLLAHVHTKFSGWINRTFVNTTGQKVSKGEALLEIYSPELVSAQEEYLEALKNYYREKGSNSSLEKSLKAIVNSVRKRLEYFDITEEQIKQLEQKGEIKKYLTLYSPFSGIVVEKNALDGMEVKPGMMLYLIADLSVVWAYADIYEYEVPWVKEGQKVTLTLPYQPGVEYQGEVDYVYPFLNEKTRTLRVRIVVPNKNQSLKPGMYANVKIHAQPVKRAVAIPLEAVLYSGERNLVFVALGKGRYAPRDVVIGVEDDNGYVEVKKGLRPGEVVVTSAQFLLDSESRLQESISKMLEERKKIKTPNNNDQSPDSKTPVKDQDHKNMDMKDMDIKNKAKTPAKTSEVLPSWNGIRKERENVNLSVNHNFVGLLGAETSQVVKG